MKTQSCILTIGKPPSDPKLARYKGVPFHSDFFYPHLQPVFFCYAVIKSPHQYFEFLLLVLSISHLSLHSSHSLVFTARNTNLSTLAQDPSSASTTQVTSK